MGADVVITCRSQEKADTAVTGIQTAAAKGGTVPHQLCNSLIVYQRDSINHSLLLLCSGMQS
jgi:hypothetical protein